MTRSHYSYRHYADSGVASSFDQLRFGGPVGRLVAEQQEQVVLQFAGALDGQRVLDVGTGTGRAACALARHGAHVTGIDASVEMLSVGRSRAVENRLAVGFLRGDAHSLPFADRAFDTCVSLRVLMHTPGWRRCVHELCRVSRSRVIVDYPAASSVAAAQAVTRQLAQRLGRSTEAYRVFFDRTIDSALAAAGFRVLDRHRQFALPIAVHKAIGSRAFTMRTESWLARLGFAALIGSPVTILAQRCGR